MATLGWAVLGPRDQGMKQFYKYLGVGAIMTVFGYGAIFFFMYILGWNPFISNIVGYAIAIICSYFLNRHFTYRSSGNVRPEALGFLGVFLIAYLANLFALKVLIDAGAHEAVGQLLAGVIYVAISYTANKYLVFKVRHQ